MCTALTLQSLQRETFFGRNMDFSYDIEPGFYVIPRNYQWYNIFTMEKYLDKYSFISLGQEKDGILGFFDGVNEQGFAAASLYFANYADYHVYENETKKTPIASLDFLHYILGRCSSIDDLYILLKNIYIRGFNDPVTGTAAPLHWFACDRSGRSVVIEQTKRGLEIFSNPIGVLANSPDFNWHMTNLRNYIELSTIQEEMANWGDVKLTPFGQGGGLSLLPGGYTSPERFARVSFLKTHIKPPENRTEAIINCFYILGSVFIPKGLVLTSKGTYDYTIYTMFINTNTCEYFFRTHDNSQIAVVGLRENYNYGTQPRFLGGLSRPVKFERYP